MANTYLLKTIVEDEVKQKLARYFCVEFEKKGSVHLPTGGTHEFDGVSLNGDIIASIKKTASGRTSGGKNPSGKIKDIEAELYYLLLAEAKQKLLVLTNVEFYRIIQKKRLKGRLHPSIQIMARLSRQTRHLVEKKVQQSASDEMKGN